MQALPMRDPERWRREAALRATLKGRYHGVSTEVIDWGVEDLSAWRQHRQIDRFAKSMRA